MWGARQRRENESRNASCASVHFTFYDLPLTIDAKVQKQELPQLQHKGKKASAPPQPKRRFEQLWGETARLLQRQPGYTYTLMFRRVASAADFDEVTYQQQTEVEQPPQGSNARRGVGAGLQTAADDNASQEEPQAVDYVEMRVWENEELHQRAQALQMPFLQQMQELGVGMSAGRYKRVFDDTLVRLIQ